MINTNKGGLGRGLGALIPKKIVEDSDISNASKDEVRLAANNDNLEKKLDTAGSVHIIEADIDKIKSNPFQPRDVFNHSELEELIASIKEHGILQPLVVTKDNDGTYELIAGERRLRSAKIAGLKSVPVIIRDVDSQKKLELALIENIQRKNLNPIEEAKAFRRLMDEFNLTQDNVSKRLGKSLAVVANSLRLLSLPIEIQTAIIEGKIDKTAGRTIAGLNSREEQIKLFKSLMERGINVRQLENYVRSRKGGGIKRIEAIDLETREKIEMLQKALGTKVKIDKKGTQGKIVIDFYSNEELTEIVKKILEK